MTTVFQYLFKNIKVFSTLIIMMIIGGIYSYANMPKSEDPFITLPISVVRVVAEGFSAQDMEQQVAIPLEKQISQLYDVKEYETIIKPNTITTTIKFNHGTDPDRSHDNVIAALNSARETFPPQTITSDVMRASPSGVGIVQIALISKSGDKRLLLREAKALQARLNRLKGVMQTNTQGIAPQVIVIRPKNPILFEMGVTLSTFHSALKATLSNGYGESNDETFKLPTKVGSNVEKIEDVRNKLITINNITSPLSYFANIEFESSGEYEEITIDNKTAILLSVQQNSGTNVFAVRDRVIAEAERFKNIIPKDLELNILVDKAPETQKRLEELNSNLLFGVSLLFIVLLIFVGRSESIIVALSIPIVFLTTLIAINALGYGLQQMTIAGLVIVVGLIVDNAIVIVEGFNKHKISSPDLKVAAQRSVSEFASSITTGTLTTVCCFLPLLFLNTDTGDFMSGLPVTVSIALVISLLISIFVIPVFLPILESRKGKKASTQDINVLHTYANKYFKKFLNKTLKTPKTVILIFTVITIALMSLAPMLGVSLFPSAEKNIIVVRGELPMNSALYSTRDISTSLNNSIKQIKGVKETILNIGASSPRIYYNHIPLVGEPNFFEIITILDEYDEYLMQNTLNQIRQLETKTANLDVFQFRQGPVADKPITVRIYGKTLDAIAQPAQELHNFMSNMSGLSNTSNPMSTPAYFIETDLKKELTQDNSQSTQQEMQLYFSKQTVGVLFDKFSDAYQIQMVSRTQSNNNGNDVQLWSNTDIPLSAALTFTKSKEYGHFHRMDGIRVGKVTADTEPHLVAAKTKEIENFLETLQLPSGVYYEIDGEEKNRVEAFGGLGISFLIALFAVFILLIWEFNSFRQCAAIASVLPFAFAGGVLGLYMGDHSFSLTAFIGIISLIGIIVNDSIILISDFNERQTNTNTFNAIKEAAVSRFAPIIITTITTVAGLLPLAIYGGLMWSPMACAVIAGLILATTSTLVFLPSVLLLMNKNNQHYQ